jgi:hypothetical protein
MVVVARLPTGVPKKHPISGCPSPVDRTKWTYALRRERIGWSHETCDEHNDVATASLIESWIDSTEHRMFLSEMERNG